MAIDGATTAVVSFPVVVWAASRTEDARMSNPPTDHVPLAQCGGSTEAMASGRLCETEAKREAIGSELVASDCLLFALEMDQLKTDNGRHNPGPTSTPIYKILNRESHSKRGRDIKRECSSS